MLEKCSPRIKSVASEAAKNAGIFAVGFAVFYLVNKNLFPSHVQLAMSQEMCSLEDDMGAMEVCCAGFDAAVDLLRGITQYPSFSTLDPFCKAYYPFANETDLCTSGLISGAQSAVTDGLWSSMMDGVALKTAIANAALTTAGSFFMRHGADFYKGARKRLGCPVKEASRPAPTVYQPF